MSLSNLPPGCTEPPDDVDWDNFIDQMVSDCDREHISVEEAQTAWTLALVLLPQVKAFASIMVQKEKQALEYEYSQRQDAMCESCKGNTHNGQAL